MKYKLTITDAEDKAKEYLKRKFLGVKNITVKTIDKACGEYIVKGEFIRRLLFLTQKRHFKINIDESTGNIKAIYLYRKIP